eukprot:gene9012-12178_t
MAISDMPMLSALRTKMQWHQERQRVLADNVSNSDTPGFRPRDLVQPKFDKIGGMAAGGPMGSLPMMRASGTNIIPTATSTYGANNRGAYETRPSGNAVNLSTLAFAGSGENTLIAGVVVSGDERVLTG